jgi:outer membrane scaffolding protein for murein synthesis (MipA/OmpV family)
MFSTQQPSRFRLNATFASLACMLLSIPAYAEEETNAPSLTNSPQVSLSTGVRIAPKYTGTTTTRTRIGLGFELDWERYRFGLTSEGLVAGWRATKELEVGMNLRQRGTRDSELLKDGALLPELEKSIEGAVYARYRWTPGFSTRLSVSQAVSDEEPSNNAGWTAELQAQQFVPLASDWSLSLSGGIVVANKRYLQRNFSVPQRAWADADAPNTGLAASSVALSLRHQWSRQVNTALGVSWTRLIGDTADSPLAQINDAQQSRAVSLGLTYRF